MPVVTTYYRAVAAGPAAAGPMLRQTLQYIIIYTRYLILLTNKRTQNTMTHIGISSPLSASALSLLLSIFAYRLATSFVLSI